MGDTYSIASEAEADREQQKAHRIYIEPTTIRGDRGQYYRVHYRGAPLIDETWNPEFEACRALSARGIAGRLEVWRFGKGHAGARHCKGSRVDGEGKRDPRSPICTLATATRGSLTECRFPCS